ncbi:MAG TPA: serine O-acetyltransferase [Pseudomonadales bacterium]|nr:serine O-acetyltransferase [Pseudomonadales bacterium]HNC69547.1 serine O-acetyltransferase [Pseudomonadales bacterium]HND13416.1 serine O-acetyltransferase [Pseudomonadales bacterium]
MKETDATRLWAVLRAEAQVRVSDEPVLASLYHATVLRHASLEDALAGVLAVQLDTGTLPAGVLRDVIREALTCDPRIAAATCADLTAHRTRDPACDSLVTAFLHYKGFHALQAQRIAHWLWTRERFWLAHLLHSCACARFDVDIHPAAVLGQGIMVDHGTGIVIGETAVVGDNVSMLHGVTLGGSGCGGGDRHPKVGSGVLLAAGARVFGPVRIGDGARIGAGSVVLDDVAPHVTVAGVPARTVGRRLRRAPALDMDQRFAAPENNGTVR